MHEFKSENTLKPDSNDRRTHRQRKNPTVLKPVSKQHLMIGISILVLLIISINSAMKSPPRIDSARQRVDNNCQSNIDFSCSPPSSDANTSSTGTTMPAGITLSQQENFVNGVPSQMKGQESVSTIPTTSVRTPSTTQNEQTNTLMMPSADRQTSGASKSLPATAHHTAVSTVSPSANSSRSIQYAPTGYYTLQLSSASQPATLNAYARKQQLSHYWIYKTYRDGKPWYVLVNGIYLSLSQAKSAIAQLPADVKVNKPWVRQIGQVQQDHNN